MIDSSETTNLLTNKLSNCLLLLGAFFLLAIMKPIEVAAAAPGDVVNCSNPFNISDSKGYTSGDPFLLADPAGVVHLFYTERTTGTPGAGPADTIMYAVWDGNTWSEPNDIQLSPPGYVNRLILGPRAVIDNQGIIHLIWMGPDNTFYYSSARANEAGNAGAWLVPVQLSDKQTGTQYSLDIAYEPPQTLHVVYGLGPSIENVTRSVSYIRSDDSGLNWSEPIDIFLFPDPERGSSNIQVLVDQPNTVFVTWTEWDLSGNGQTVYFLRSLDSGNTWDFPIPLADRLEGEYERDWSNPFVLDEDRLIVMWEGGFRAYPQAQYSDDGGVTWSEPVDQFNTLIADNGYANIVRDGSGRVHTFLVRRVREGNECRFPGCAEAEENKDTNTLWHSVWEGGRRWREPKPVGNFVFDIGADESSGQALGQIGGNFTSVAINGGNQLVTAWFDYAFFELITMVCEIEGASVVEPQPWPTLTPQPTATLRPTTTALTVSPAGSNQIPIREISANDLAMPPNRGTSPATPIFLALVPVLVIIVSFAFYLRAKNRGQ